MAHLSEVSNRPRVLLQVIRLVFLLAELQHLVYCTTSSANNTIVPDIAKNIAKASNNRKDTGRCSDIMETLNDIVRQLEEKKTTRYPPVFPHKHKTGFAVPVQINLLPLHLMHVDDAHSQLSLSLLFLIYWRDPRLAWANTTTYDPGCKSKLPARLSLRDIRDIWTPTLILAESTASTKRGLHEIFESMQISQTGNVYYAGRYRDDIICPMKRRYYPFDEQVCNITVLGGDYVRYEVGTSWNRYYYSDGSGVKASNGGGNETEEAEEQFIKWVLESYRQTEYETHIFGRRITTSEWKLNPTDDQLVASLTRPIVIRHAAAPQPKSYVLQSQSLVFQLYLKRDSWPLVWTMVIPPIVISVTAVVSMYLACPIQGRLGFGATIIISLSLLIRNLNDRLENGDDGSPLLHWLYLGLFFSVILATTLSEIPHRMAKERKKQHAADERSRRGSPLACHSWLARTIGIEEIINLYFAIGFVLFQAVLTGFVAFRWLKAPSLTTEPLGSES